MTMSRSTSRTSAPTAGSSTSTATPDAGSAPRGSSTGGNQATARPASTTGAPAGGTTSSTGGPSPGGSSSTTPSPTASSPTSTSTAPPTPAPSPEQELDQAITSASQPDILRIATTGALKQRAIDALITRNSALLTSIVNTGGADWFGPAKDKGIATDNATFLGGICTDDDKKKAVLNACVTAKPGLMAALIALGDEWRKAGVAVGVASSNVDLIRQCATTDEQIREVATLLVGTNLDLLDRCVTGGAPNWRTVSLDVALTAANATAIEKLANDEATRTTAIDRLITTNVALVVSIMTTSTAADAWKALVLRIVITREIAAALDQVTPDAPARQAAIDAAIAAGKVDFLLGHIGVSTAAALWEAACDSGRYGQVLTAATKPAPAAANQGIWKLYGNGSARAGQERATFDALFGNRISPTGDPTLQGFYQTETRPGGDPAVNITYDTGLFFSAVDPSPATMGAFLNEMRVLPAGHVSASRRIAFCFKQWKAWRVKSVVAAPPGVAVVTPAPAVGTILYSDGIDMPTSMQWNAIDAVLMRSTQTGDIPTGPYGLLHQAAASGSVGAPQATPDANTPALTYFQNHARHEVGHAIGDRSLAGVGETGNAFATQYGGWTPGDPDTLWTATGTSRMHTNTDRANWLTRMIWGTSRNATDVRDWLKALVSSGTQPAGNPITDAEGTLAQKLTEINAVFGDQELTKYVMALYRRNNNPAAWNDGGYQFPGFTFSGDPVPFMKRWGNRWARYSAAAYNALQPSLGWYSLASPQEMWAELYTHKYSRGTLPPAVNGKDPADFFRKLDASTDSSVVAPGSASPVPAPGAAPSGARPATIDTSPIAPPETGSPRPASPPALAG